MVGGADGREERGKGKGKGKGAGRKKGTPVYKDIS